MLSSNFLLKNGNLVIRDAVSAYFGSEHITKYVERIVRDARARGKDSVSWIADGAVFTIWIGQKN